MNLSVNDNMHIKAIILIVGTRQTSLSIRHLIAKLNIQQVSSINNLYCPSYPSICIPFISTDCIKLPLRCTTDQLY